MPAAPTKAHPVGGVGHVVAGTCVRQKRGVVGVIFLVTVCCLVALTTLGKATWPSTYWTQSREESHPSQSPVQSSVSKRPLHPESSRHHWARRKHGHIPVTTAAPAATDAATAHPLDGDVPDEHERQLLAEASRKRQEADPSQPSYPSPEERLKHIEKLFAERNMGPENVCDAMERGEIKVDRHRRRGGKKSAWMATWKGQKVVVKKNDYEKDRNNADPLVMWDRNFDHKVSKPEFFKTLRNALTRMGLGDREMDSVFDSVDVNKDGSLNSRESRRGAKIVKKMYNHKLAPEALILGENPDLKIFPRYYGHCKTSYVVEFLPIHSLHSYVQEKFPIRARIAASLLEWAKTAMDKGFFACDVILGNFAMGADGIVKVNDLDQVHSREDVMRWKDLTCKPGEVGNCFDDGHCRMKCTNKGKCPVMGPDYNHKQLCERLFLRKKLLANPPAHLQDKISKLLQTCAHGSSERTLKSASRLYAILLEASRDVKSIRPPSFAGQMRFGKRVDRASAEDRKG